MFLYSENLGKKLKWISETENETVNRDGNQTALKLPSTLNRDVNQTILQSHSCWWILSKWIEVILHASCSISRQNLNDILAWCFKWYTTFLKLGLKLFLYEDILWIIMSCCGTQVVFIPGNLWIFMLEFSQCWIINATCFVICLCGGIFLYLYCC